MYKSTQAIPNNQTGLVLGTSKYLINGKQNPFFKKRMEAAAHLYHAGKIKFIIASGDNSTMHYNEPQMMKNALVALGVNPDHIFLDYAGFRTLDSVIRAREIFGQKNLTIISQDFQNKRALYVAKAHGINAIAFNAENVNSKTGFKTYTREAFARVLVVVDVKIIHRKPHFLGEKITIE